MPLMELTRKKVKPVIFLAENANSVKTILTHVSGELLRPLNSNLLCSMVID